jgi:hypothetical protein
MNGSRFSPTRKELSKNDLKRWWGSCWVIYEFAKYEFKLEFEVKMAKRDTNGLSIDSH